MRGECRTEPRDRGRPDRWPGRRQGLGDVRPEGRGHRRARTRCRTAAPLDRCRARRSTATRICAGRFPPTGRAPSTCHSRPERGRPRSGRPRSSVSRSISAARLSRPAGMVARRASSREPGSRWRAGVPRRGLPARGVRVAVIRLPPTRRSTRHHMRHTPQGHGLRQGRIDAVRRGRTCNAFSDQGPPQRRPALDAQEATVKSACKRTGTFHPNEAMQPPSHTEAEPDRNPSSRRLTMTSIHRRVATIAIVVMAPLIHRRLHRGGTFRPGRRRAGPVRQLDRLRNLADRLR